jgi:hypothetical protein
VGTAYENEGMPYFQIAASLFSALLAKTVLSPSVIASEARRSPFLVIPVLRSEGRQALSRDRCVPCHPRTFLSAFADLFIYYLASAFADLFICYLATEDKTADRSGIYNMKIRSTEVEKQKSKE